MQQVLLSEVLGIKKREKKKILKTIWFFNLLHHTKEVYIDVRINNQGEMFFLIELAVCKKVGSLNLNRCNGMEF